MACAAVVQQQLVPVDVVDQAQAPQGRGAPLAAIGFEVRPAIGQAFSHVMQ